MSAVYDYTTKLCSALKTKHDKAGFSCVPCEFVIEEGRKYYKIIKVGEHQRSVHAFVYKKSGDLYKAHSWAAPAKGIRYNLMNDLENVLTKCDWAGSYLYR
jgi:hypothetical protein